MNELDKLYAAPLGEFTAKRNKLVEDLRQKGDTEGAAAIKALKKPSVIAWTVNQLARRNQAEIRELLAAGERLRKAHRKALSSAGAVDLRGVASQERAIIRELLVRAEGIMKEAGIPASRAQMGAVEETLSAAAVDEDGRELLEHGRLTKELQRVGFGDVSALTVVPGGRGAKEPEGEDAATIESERSHARELERAARAAERAAERLERIAETAAEKLDRLREKTAEAEVQASVAASEADEARRAALLARSDADKAKG